MLCFFFYLIKNRKIKKIYELLLVAETIRNVLNLLNKNNFNRLNKNTDKQPTSVHLLYYL